MNRHIVVCRFFDEFHRPQVILYAALSDPLCGSIGSRSQDGRGDTEGASGTMAVPHQHSCHVRLAPSAQLMPEIDLETLELELSCVRRQAGAARFNGDSEPITN
jgi:hypothetical protein